MSAPVQAQSISSLNNLLANPPQYPRNPTHEVHQPLVLYIVRVPGSKDVFLTPLKPPTKASISIEAVQSSLYFLHVERPEDEELRQSLEASRVADSRNHDVSPIQRKPLPPTPYANYPASQRPPTPPKSYPHYQPPLPDSQDATQAERYSARGTHLRLSIADSAQSPRHPAGARPMPAGPILQPSTRANNSEGDLSPSPIERAQRQFRLARKPLQTDSQVNPAQIGNGERGHPSPSQASPDRLAPGDGVNELERGTARIFLIRRDPATGSQWNVGSISLKGGATPLRQVEIELTNPGYGKFAQLEGRGAQGFQRKVGYTLAPNSEGSLVTRKRSNSAESFSNSPFPGGRRPRQTYGFMSPWQGVCSFSNGLDGRSLRCRHSVPAANPSTPAVAADVAELRFNLPWASLRLRDPHKSTSDISESSPNIPVGRPSIPSNKEHWRKSFQTLTHKARMQLSSTDSHGDTPSVFKPLRRGSADPDPSSEEGRLNLDLGREKAGGGFKGHSAKLGKLIVDDEGLKMCDLVVAACMGVWWQHYAGDML